MKVGMAIGLVTLTLTNPCGGAAPDAKAPEASMTTTSDPLNGGDEAAVRALITEFADSWNRHDMTAMHALDTPDVEWVNVVGNHWVGLANVHKGHQNFHRVMAAKSTANVETVSLHPIAPDVAIAVATLHFGGVGPSGKAEDVKTRGSFVAVRRAGVWKIVHFHNTIINPMTQGPNDPLAFDEKTGLPAAEK